jgi:hypothetical protein
MKLVSAKARKESSMKTSPDARAYAKAAPHATAEEAFHAGVLHERGRQRSIQKAALRAHDDALLGVMAKELAAQGALNAARTVLHPTLPEVVASPYNDAAQKVADAMNREREAVADMSRPVNDHDEF